MGRQKKAWILVKGCEFNPGRSLALGQILADPYAPDLSLLPHVPLPVESKDVEHSYQEGVVKSSSSLLHVSFGVWAEINLLPVTGGVGTAKHIQRARSWQFDRLEGQIVVPRLEDVKTALETDSVTEYIGRIKWNFRKRLYIVTGVRIAHGARLTESVSTGIEGSISAGVDLTALSGAPVTVGVDASLTRGAHASHAFQGSSSFVFAYRLAELWYGKNTHLEPFTSGETFNLDSGREDEERAEIDDEDSRIPKNHSGILVEGIDPSDYKPGEKLRWAAETDTDEEEAYYVPRN